MCIPVVAIVRVCLCVTLMVVENSDFSSAFDVCILGSFRNKASIIQDCFYLSSHWLTTDPKIDDLE